MNKNYTTYLPLLLAVPFLKIDGNSSEEDFNHNIVGKPYKLVNCKFTKS